MFKIWSKIAWTMHLGTILKTELLCPGLLSSTWSYKVVLSTSRTEKM